MNGIINIYKEAGFTSFDVVAKLRGILKTKKIGHTGTLDPDAVGVLPVCVGNATKVVELLADDTKEYVATLKLGIVTDTQDTSGTILENNTEELCKLLNSGALNDNDIRNAILSFTGDIEQIPPMYSALKVNGQKLVDLARKGIEVERKARPVKIYEIELLEEEKLEEKSEEKPEEKPEEKLEEKLEESDKIAEALKSTENAQTSLHNIYRFRVVCSKGTYIRTLCHDIGRKIGCGGCMAHLERTRVGVFKKEDAYTLGEVQRMIDQDIDLHNIITPVDIMFQNYPALHVSEGGMKALNNGNQLQPVTISEVNDKKIMLISKQVYRIYSYDNQFRALYEYHSGWKVLTPVKMFA